MSGRPLLGFVLVGMVGTPAAMAQDALTFRQLDPGRYPIESVVDDRVAAQSGLIELSPDAMRVASVSVIRPPTWVHTTRRVEALPRVSARQLLGTRDVPSSFDELQSVLRIGHRVRFGRREVLVAEVSRDRLVLLRRRFFRTQEIVLPADAVQRLDIVDSTRNGTLIGLAVGGALGAAMAVDTHRNIATTSDCSLCPLGYMAAAALPVLGGSIGQGIDAVLNEPVYEGRAPTPTVSLAPLFGRGAIGISAQVRF